MNVAKKTTAQIAYFLNILKDVMAKTAWYALIIARVAWDILLGYVISVLKRIVAIGTHRMMQYLSPKKKNSFSSSPFIFGGSFLFTF